VALEIQDLIVLISTLALVQASLFPILIAKLPTLATPYAKADLGRRVTAAIIDLFICAFWSYWSLGLNKYYFIAGMIYLLLKDCLFSGRSVGKLVVGLMVIDVRNGKPCTLKQSMLRNMIFVIPGLNLPGLIYELIVTKRDPKGIRIGDRLSETQVVMGKELLELSKFFQWLLMYHEGLLTKRQGTKDHTSRPHHVDSFDHWYAVNTGRRKGRCRKNFGRAKEVRWSGTPG